MNVLVANDDGINAEGIHRLAEALSKEADVYVCAPDGQRSASGHGITVSERIKVRAQEFSGAEYAMAISGTPADCVKLGIGILAEKGIKIDMVFAGINHGANLGTDTLYSGTVSAALEGSICGVPSVAVSVTSHGASHFGYACHLAVEALKRSQGRLSSEYILNINVPDIPDEEVKGVKITTLGKREYDNFFTPVENEDGSMDYTYSGDPVVDRSMPDSTDVIALEDGYASITPVHHDLTAYSIVEEVGKWRIV